MSDTTINKEDFFSLDNLGEIADFNEHLSFAEKMLNKYNWEPGARDKISALLRQIRSKQEDKLLNMSVIGEFSSGKSTFINAMLRCELLSSAALQGTTVASTVIEPANWFGIELRYDDGRKQIHEFDGLASLRQSLESFTTDPDIARKLESVKVYLPSKHLNKGFRVIDTPGTNAIERWHEEVTVRTIRDISDVSIILVDAVKPLPESLCYFIMSNLENVLNQCVFVVTKMDLLREKEREQMLSYIRSKLKTAFELESPMVLPYSSTNVMDSFENGAESALSEASFRSEAEMFSRMTRQRASLQAKKLISLIDYMYGYIRMEIDNISKDSEAELERLMRSKQADLTSFVSAQKLERAAAFEAAVKNDRAEMVNGVHVLSGQAYSDFVDKINGINNTDDLSAFVKNDLVEYCSEKASIITEVGLVRTDLLSTHFHDQIRLFWNAFEALFKDLDILQVDLSDESIDVEVNTLVVTGDLSEANVYLDEQIKSENFAFFGGMAAGAVVGSMIAPGVGTVIGGLIGLVAGAPSNSKLEKIKSNTLSKLEGPVRRYFNDAAGKAISALDNYINTMSDAISSEIDRYLGKYNDTVEKRIKEEEQAQKKVEIRLADIRRDMKDIENRKFRLSSVSEHINFLI